jgi:hypothetical protein
MHPISEEDSKEGNYVSIADVAILDGNGDVERRIGCPAKYGRG